MGAEWVGDRRRKGHVAAARAFALAGLVCAGPAAALDLEEEDAPTIMDARTIMQAATRREDGDTRTSRLTLTLTDFGGRTLVRTIQSRSMDFEDETRTRLWFEAPGEVRGTGVLLIDYADANRDDDVWLYLPDVRKSVRISSAEKSGPFLGTDLTYADMTPRSVDHSNYALLSPSERMNGEDCWVIEVRPRTEKEAQETGYLKRHVWVSKAKQVPVRVKSWVRAGRKLKYMKFSQFEQIDGIWVAKRLDVRVMKAGEVQSRTTLVTEEVRFNPAGVTSSDFKRARLEQGL